jgi:eukaryotic-like serine/threonine-protein kinase
MTPSAGSTIGGKYLLEAPLAGGGMGAIWAAHHVGLESPVVVKFMLSELSGDVLAQARFEREARAAAQLRSPHVVQILDYGVEAGTPYIAMERLQGEDLRARLRAVGRLSLRAASELLTQAAKGLKLAHDAGIVHRDLKPSNLFLARVGDEEIVKILDFGIAKQTSTMLIGEQTASGQLVGSPHHMSPEQARGGIVDHRSDLWSLAVVLFEAVSGQRPFSGDHVGNVIASICADPLPAPSSFAPDLPAAVDRFFARAMARDPAERFATARAMAEAFSALLELPELRPIADRAPASVAGASQGPSERSVIGRLEPTAPLGAELELGTLEASSIDTAERGARSLPVAGTRPAPVPVRSRARRALLLGAGALAASALAGAFLLRGPEPAQPPRAASEPSSVPARIPSGEPAIAAPARELDAAAPSPSASAAVGSRPRAAPRSPSKAKPAASVHPVFGLPVNKGP